MREEMQRPIGAQDRASSETLEDFLNALNGLHVQTHVVRSESETVDAVRAIVSKAGCKSVVVAGIPARYKPSVKAALSGINHDYVEDLQGRPTSEAVKVLASADAGITWASNGLAMEGAMLEVVYDDSFKLASSLPILHVAMLEASSVLSDLSDALPRIGDTISNAPPGKKPVISFISGPSKTGDIEMRLLYGVHGPHTVHAIILDWS